MTPARHVLLPALVLVALLSGAGLVYSADKKDRDKEDIALEKHEKVLQDARRRLETVKKQTTQARTALDKAEDALRKEKTAAEQVRQDAIEKHDGEPQLVKARKELEQAEAAFKTASAPVLRRLSQDLAYQALLRDRDTKRQQLESAPADGKEQFASLALTAAQAVTKSEQAAIGGDPAAAAARQRVAAARIILQKLVEERDRKIAQDAHVQRASAQVAGAKQHLDSAQDTVERAARELGTVQRQLQAEEQEHKRLADAERRDDARDKAAAAPKKNNPKKK